MAATSVGAVALDLTLNDRSFNKNINSIAKGTEGAFSSTMKKVGGFIAGAFAVKSVTDFTKTCIDSASQVQSAFTGLNSIVQGTGNSFADAQKFINEYTADGLVSIEETATAYKNLLSRGYDSSQIEDVLTRLKDSAAFGRQASYDLGEAVVSATEGLKNENSILVDNAGVTKNVAKMWDEYAKSIGTTANNLTQEQKIQAEYNGIMKETQFQVGDAAAHTQTFSGQIQQLKFNFNQMTVAIGKVVTPIAQLFIPIINSAISAVTGLFEKIQVILGAFGLQMPSVVSKASSSIGSVGASMDSTADSADAAVSAAKEMNKAFADVDEINVLDTKSSSGSSGGSSNGHGTSTGTSIAVTPAADNAVNSAITATIDKIKKYIEPLQNISFDNLINAFQGLKDAISPITSNLFDGLSWAYFNILVPLSQWTIEDLLPAFLNLLSGALTVLNPVLESFGNIFTPIWNNLLQPLLSWTGGAIVTVLEGVAGALETVGNWMSSNQGVVDAMVLSIGTFFALWKLTEIMGFIQMSGGLIAAITAITTAIKGATIAKMADKIETVAITAMYAKDFVVSIVQGTASLASQAVQWGITTAAKVADTVATTAATTATWLFNAALAVLTSPITLVVAAIAGLIAIVYLLIDNWDAVSTAASACWDWIVNVFNGAADWFNNTVVQPIVNFFSGMWSGLTSGATDAWNGIKSVFSTVATFFRNTFERAWTAVKNVFSTGGKIFDGIKEGIVDAFKTVVNAIITGINKVVRMPFDGINGILNGIRNTDIFGIKPFEGLWGQNPLSVPQIPMLAQGSWFPRNNPQLAIVGDNKQEPEIVTPESKIYDQTLKAIKDSGGIGKQTIEIVIYHKFEDGKTIIQKINQAQIDAGEVLLVT